MVDTFKDHALQIILVFLVFFLFVSNATGLLDFNLNSGGGISVRSILLQTSSGQGFSLPAVVQSSEFIVLLVTGIVLSLFLPVLSPIKASLLTAISAIPPISISISKLGTHTLLPMEYSLLTILMLYAFNVLIGYFKETHSKQKIINIFSQYVPPELVSEISKHSNLASLEGESRQLTVFFCDMQNFTGTAEQLNPKQLVRLLNEYFTAMTEILFKYNATIDKYIGDSIMAFWGAPIPQSDHAKRAVLASFDMHKEIHKLSGEFIKKGWPGPKMSIGINTGIMSVGNMGSKYRIAYTVIGDAVNLASRLESLTRVYGVPTIVSEATKNEIDGIVFRALDIVQVKGKHNKTKIYQPICTEDELSDTQRQQLDYHQQGVDHYNHGELGKTKAIFEELKNTDESDKFYTFMLDKISKSLNS